MANPLWSVGELVEELRDSAKETAAIVGTTPDQTVEGQAAEVLVEWRETLAMIAEGCPNPKEAARQALKAQDQPGK